MKKTIKNKEEKNLPGGKVLYILRFADGTEATTFSKSIFDKVVIGKEYDLKIETKGKYNNVVAIITETMQDFSAPTESKSKNEILEKQIALIRESYAGALSILGIERKEAEKFQDILGTLTGLISIPVSKKQNIQFYREASK